MIIFTVHSFLNTDFSHILRSWLKVVWIFNKQPINHKNDDDFIKCFFFSKSSIKIIMHCTCTLRISEAHIDNIQYNAWESASNAKGHGDKLTRCRLEFLSPPPPIKIWDKRNLAVSTTYLIPPAYWNTNRFTEVNICKVFNEVNICTINHYLLEAIVCKWLS